MGSGNRIILVVSTGEMCANHGTRTRNRWTNDHVADSIVVLSIRIFGDCIVVQGFDGGSGR